MDLKTFVSSTLQQIVRGVELAQTELADSDAQINPGARALPPRDGMPGVPGKYGLQHVRDVTFDVAITAGDEQTAGANGGVKVMGLQLGGSGGVRYENSSVSRIQFVVPIALPMAKGQ